MRNILARVSHKQKEVIGKHLSHIFNQANYDQAKQTANEVIAKFSSQFPDAMDCLADGLEDALQFFHFEELPFGRTSSTNHLERLNREIRRRSSVVGTFPSTQSFLRLIGSYLFEYQADWPTGKSYIKPDRLALFQSNLFANLAA
jgi:transposase-like protein